MNLLILDLGLKSNGRFWLTKEMITTESQEADKNKVKRTTIYSTPII